MGGIVLTHQRETFVNGTGKIGLNYLKFSYPRKENRIVHGYIGDICSNIVAKPAALFPIAKHHQLVVYTFVGLAKTRIWIRAGGKQGKEENDEKQLKEN